MKKVIAIIFWICLVPAALGSSPALAKHRLQVLVIHSYHKGFTWTDQIDDTLRRVLARHPDIEIVSEYLDSKRIALDQVAPDFLALIAGKYRDHPPDAIILTDNNALTFMQQVYQVHFPGIPVIFCGINNFSPDLIASMGSRVTGVVEKTDPAGTAALIRQLVPGLEKLVIVTGTSPTALAIKAESEAALAGLEEEVDLVWKHGLATGDLLAYLETLSSRDAVLLISFNRDRDGHYYTYEESARLISRHSGAPVFGLWDFYLGTGVVGGRMVSSRDQGTAAAEKCLAALESGTLPPMDLTSPNALLIDYPAFSARDLSPSRLPPATLVLNKPLSFYQTHKPLIWGVIIFVSILVILIIILGVTVISRRELDRKYRNLFESSMDAIFLISPDLHITDCNPAALELFRISSREAFLDLTPVALSPERQPDGEPTARKAERLMAATLEKGRHLFEWRHRRPDGEEFDASVRLSLTTLQGRPAILATVRDISEQKQAQELLIQSEKMMSVGGLAAGMAHEINNPLAGMIQNASVLYNRLTRLDIPVNRSAAREAGTSMEAIAAFMERRNIPKMARAITESGARIAAIVENMLSFSRKGDSGVSSHHPADLLDRVLDLAATDFDLKKHYDFKNIVIEKVYEPDLPLVPCHGSKVQQVLLNILKNGAQAMAETPGEVPPKFILRLAHDAGDSMLRIEIQDNGPGMDKAVSQRIFEPFFTTKPIGEGTGLGLSVSYFIITDNHRGTLTVSSEPGKGSTFTIRLPLTADPAP